MRAPIVSIVLFLAAAVFLLSPLALKERRPSRLGEAAAPILSEPTAAASTVDFLPAYAALDPEAPADEAAAPPPAFNPADPYGGLPQTEGFDLVAARCGACHSLNIVMHQSLPRSRWDSLLTLMVEQHRMPPLEAPDRRLVLDYLSRTFGAARE